MRDGWPDDLMADAPRSDDAFKSSLRERLLETWDEDVPVPGVSTAHRPRRWTVIAAAAVVAVGVAGFLVLRTAGSSGSPTSPGPAPSAPTTAEDVVGTWVVTQSNGMPRPSPLPTYRFKLGTSPAGTGVVTGFDGCREVTGTWSVDNGRLAVTSDDGDGGRGCPALGTTTTLVSFTDLVMTQFEGQLVMQFGDASDTVVRRVDDLPAPATLTDRSWLLPVDGSDLTLAFATNDLTVTTDAIVCTRTSYSYDTPTLRIDAAAGGAPSGSCQNSLPPSLENTLINVVEFGDEYSTSLLFITPDGGTQRVYPAPAGEAAVEETESTSTAPKSAPTATASTQVESGEAVPLVLPASSGMTPDIARQGALEAGGPIRWYTTGGASPEDGPYLRVISGTHAVPIGQPLGCVIGDPTASGSTRDDVLADGTPVCLTVRPPTELYGQIAVDLSPTSIIIEGNATDDQLLAAAAHLTSGPAGGYEIDPAGWPAGVTEVGTGVAVSDFATASLAAVERSMIQVGWSDASGRSLFYVATRDDQAPATMRLNFATITDTNIRGEPAFLRTLPDQPAYLGAVWNHDGTTYQVGSQGLTERELRELLDELRIPTTSEWNDLLASASPTLPVSGAPTTTS